LKEVPILANTVTPQCENSLERWKNLAKWRNLWTILLFVFGSTIVLFLCVAILLFIKQSWVGGAVTSGGTIASGTAISWVVSRRNESVTEEIDAYKDVENKCAVAPKTEMHALSPSKPILIPEVQKQVGEFVERKKIFFKSIR
jgi:hypothetical protein